MTKIKLGIVGYGNLGKGAELAIRQQEDMELVAVFTRRDPASIQLADSSVKVVYVDEAENYVDQIDVMILCGGSAKDLPEQTPSFTRLFNTIDSYDTHEEIPEHFKKVDEVAQESGSISIISVGWDPGLFSLNRMLSEAILPRGKSYTFWGRGLSQGHSEAVRRVEGVYDAVQYTIPSEEAIEQVRTGEKPELSPSDQHIRSCFVVTEEGADREKIAETIKSMPHYFAPYETEVHFITQEELEKNHAKMPHGGFVIRSGETGDATHQKMEFNLQLDSNPEFTASVLVAYARAAAQLHKEGQKGARTIFDIAPRYLSIKTAEQLQRKYL